MTFAALDGVIPSGNRVAVPAVLRLVFGHLPSSLAVVCAFKLRMLTRFFRINLVGHSSSFLFTVREPRCQRASRPRKAEERPLAGLRSVTTARISRPRDRRRPGRRGLRRYPATALTALTTALVFALAAAFATTLAAATLAAAFAATLAAAFATTLAATLRGVVRSWLSLTCLPLPLIAFAERTPASATRHCPDY